MNQRLKKFGVAMSGGIQGLSLQITESWLSVAYRVAAPFCIFFFAISMWRFGFHSEGFFWLAPAWPLYYYGKKWHAVAAKQRDNFYRMKATRANR